jgi:hypothetical protein
LLIEEVTRDKGTSLRSVFNSRYAAFQRLTAFNPHFMGFKHLTSFGVQFQI